MVGDAFHPMTPDMTQDGCAALEDAVVLARALSRPGAGAADSVTASVAERRARAAWNVAGAYLTGYVQQGSTGVPGMRAYAVKLFREWIFYRFVFPLLADMMWFNYGDLAPQCDNGEEEAGEEKQATRAIYTEPIVSVVQSLQVGPDHLYHYIVSL
ncbi:hypothetical protein E2562_002390 [Oryza meyeriana var. granulata]|uniref:FAD-binding domain-containing protein n=1 Tax=Oryza meyeriana var. granulata TaxID=110450 RepID=A0A6G1BIC6_9ORYZ|nr:hypothetical protein E2562_002390 [Oryza meyeriana var. granulata]